jgi:hypothetical protein
MLNGETIISRVLIGTIWDYIYVEVGKVFQEHGFGSLSTETCFSLHQKLKSFGVKIKLPPTNFSWAYEMQVEDPDGHVLRFGTDPNDKEPFADK